MKKNLLKKITGSLESADGEATEMALQEIRDLKKDLLQVERFLTSKRKKAITTAPLFDIVHGALEVFRHVSRILGSREMLQDLEGEIKTAREQDTLEELGATLLTRPPGWHWISPQGEMVFLGDEQEEAKALKKLKRLQSGAGNKSKEEAAKGGNGKKASQE